MSNYDEDLGRDVSDDERALMHEVLIRQDRGPYNEIRAIPAGRQAGLHEERTRQIVRTWVNDGIASSPDDGNLIRLTEYGRSVGERLTND